MINHAADTNRPLTFVPVVTMLLIFPYKNNPEEEKLQRLLYMG
jgi:hypothetical protein